MKNLLKVWVFLTAVAACAVLTASNPPSLMEGALLQEDLHQLRSSLLSYHAGMYWYSTPQEWERSYNRSMRRAGNGMTFLDFNKEITRLVAEVHCGHTRSWFTQTDAYKDTTFTVPISIRIIEGVPIVHEVLQAGTGIKRGDQVIAINGVPMDNILYTMMTHTSGDGRINSGKTRFIEKRFHFLYPELINPDGFRYEVQVATGKEQPRMVELRGIRLRKYPVPLMKEDFNLVEFKQLNGAPQTYYMAIRTFVNAFFDKQGVDYFKFLDKSFTQLKKNGAEHLIIDLRGNGGGDDGNGSELLSYLAREPFNYYRAIEVTDQYTGWGEVVQAENNRHLMTSHPNLSLHEPKKNRFEGNVYVLIDGGSFSATSEFGAMVHHLQLGKFVGEETGGGYQGNTSGPRKKVVLKNSGISVSIPLWRYLVAVDESPGHFGRGVIPDYPVEPDLKDYLAGRDVVLDYSLLLIKQSL